MTGVQTCALPIYRHPPPGQEHALPARKILGALSRFAEYCGTGAQVTHGFGATTLTSPNA